MKKREFDIMLSRFMPKGSDFEIYSKVGSNLARVCIWSNDRKTCAAENGPSVGEAFEKAVSKFSKHSLETLTDE